MLLWKLPAEPLTLRLHRSSEDRVPRGPQHCNLDFVYFSSTFAKSKFSTPPLMSTQTVPSGASIRQQSVMILWFRVTGGAATSSHGGQVAGPSPDTHTSFPHFVFPIKGTIEWLSLWNVGANQRNQNMQTPTEKGLGWNQTCILLACYMSQYCPINISNTAVAQKKRDKN